MLRSLARFVAAAFTVLALAPAAAQDWPNKPIRLIVPFPPGGTTDQIARVLGAYLTPALGQQVVVDNRAGASGALGTGIAAHAAPDGYTFVVVFDTHGVNPSLIPNMGFDTMKDLAPLMLIGTAPNAIVANPAAPYRSFGDLVAAAKAKPETISFGTVGAGSLGHLMMTVLQNQGGFKMIHVPYKGGGPLLQDAIAGHVPVAVGSLLLVVPHIETKRLRPLAVSTAKRSPQAPDIPTVAEQGFPGFDVSTWWGMLAPAKTPQAVLKRMHAEVVKVLNLPAARDRLVQQGVDIKASTPEELNRFVAGELERWGKVVRDNKIRLGD